MKSICRVCGQNGLPFEAVRVVSGYPIVLCAQCNTVHVPEEALPNEIEKQYDSLFADGGYAQHRREYELIKRGRVPRSYFRTRLLKRLEGVMKGRTMIEIGGGTGLFGLIAESRGWRYTNYDVSDVAVGYCQGLGLSARKYSMNAHPDFGESCADLVVMWEVIEHVPNVFTLLKLIRGALRSGGALLLSTPNYLTPSTFTSDAWGVLGAPPIHVNFFTEQSIKNTLSSNHFSNLMVGKRRLYRPTMSLDSVLTSLRMGFGL